MQLREVDREGLADGDDQLGQERASIGVEQLIERPPEPVIADLNRLLGREPEEHPGKAVHRLLLAVDRLALDQDRAHQHAERLGMRDRVAPINGWDVSLEQRIKAQSVQEVVDERQRSDAFSRECEPRIMRRCWCRPHSCASISARYSKVNPNTMPKRTPQEIAATARERIERIRAELAPIDVVCSGTLLKRMKTCGSPSCRCATDPDARHGPYYEWGHMKAGKLLHRLVSPPQAEALRRSIANYRKIKKLLRAWEAETERLIDAEHPRSS